MKQILMCVGAFGAVVFLAALARPSSSPAVSPRPAAAPAAASVAPPPVEMKAPVAATAEEDFNSRGCTHDHEGAEDPVATPVAGPPEDPFEYPARTLDRIASELAVSRECATKVGRVLSDHLSATAQVERELGDGVDASVTERLWEQAEESLGKLLTVAQIEKLKLMPLEAPPSARREHSMGGK